MIFREAVESDYPSIMALHKSENWGLDTLSALKNFHKLNTIVVCEENNLIVGKMDLMQKSKADRSFLYIERLIVHPEYRHKGIAKKFITYAENECKKRTLDAVELAVREDNDAAVHIYTSSGFQILGKKVYMQKRV